MARRRLLLVPSCLAALVALALLGASAAWAGGMEGGPTPCAPCADAATVPDCTCRADYEVTLDLGVYSMYVWRGIRIFDGFVAQPSIDVAAAGFTLNVWANLDLEKPDQGDFTEVDLTGSWSHSFGCLDVTFGAVSYLFPTGGDQTTELFAGVGFDVLLSPSLTVYQDIDEVEGTYVALGGSHTFEDPFGLGECRGLSPELSASIGWGSEDYDRYYFGGAGSGLVDLTLGLRIPYRITRITTIAASVHWTSLLDDAVRDAMDDPDSLWFGLSATVSF